MIWLPVLVLSGILVLLVLGSPWLVRRWARQEELAAQQLFRGRREVLEARFFEQAAACGKPRGLRWKHCDWKDQVVFAREAATGLITAFASVEIHFEAIEGGDMEEVEAVSDVRDASAVFHYQQGAWGTGGKALFNMSPDEALQRLAGQFQPLECGNH